MKRSILISAALIIATASYAQSDCTSGSDNALFKFDNAGTAREVRTLGSSPEFPFLRNMSSPKQVYAAIMRNDKRNTQGMGHLNDLLMAVGFANGAKDLNESNITTYYIPPGTAGNMGSGDYSSGYYRLVGDASMFKAWKISSGSGCYMYLLAKCGNAFYPKTENRSACIMAPVNLNSDSKEVTLNSSGQQSTTVDNIYVYYSRRRHRRHEKANTIPEITAAYPSMPILLRTTNDVTVIPETYKVTVNTPDNTVQVCPDSTLNITANINVEKTSEYSGYYPDKNKKEYKQVSKRVYRRVARKMRKAERKEHRIDKLTGVTVNV